MELKEYFFILKKHQKTFWFGVFVITALGLLYFLFRPISYTTSLTINITRAGVQETADYKYDDFYRLQADDKFAETVVEWLKSPRTIADIYHEAGLAFENLSLKKLAGSIKAEKMSSQVIAVSFGTVNKENAEKISPAIAKILAKNISQLNESQKESTWFQIVAHDPITVKDNFNLFLVTLIFLPIGIFLAFWLVLIIHYLE